eukprot:SAG31_NODE_2450_length_5668_cov_32.512300_3_plen_178_part_00
MQLNVELKQRQKMQLNVELKQGGCDDDIELGEAQGQALSFLSVVGVQNRWSKLPTEYEISYTRLQADPAATDFSCDVSNARQDMSVESQSCKDVGIVFQRCWVDVRQAARGRGLYVKKGRGPKVQSWARVEIIVGPAGVVLLGRKILKLDRAETVLIRSCYSPNCRLSILSWIDCRA